MIAAVQHAAQELALGPARLHGDLGDALMPPRVCPENDVTGGGYEQPTQTSSYCGTYNSVLSMKSIHLTF